MTLWLSVAAFPALQLPTSPLRLLEHPHVSAAQKVELLVTHFRSEGAPEVPERLLKLLFAPGVEENAQLQCDLIECWMVQPELFGSSSSNGTAPLQHLHVNAPMSWPWRFEKAEKAELVFANDG